MLRAIALATAILLANTAMAHEDHIGPNGGYTKHLGSVSVELVTEGRIIRVHIRDEKTETPLPVAGAKGRVIILAGGKTESVALQPAGDVLVGTAKQEVPLDAKVAVSLQIPGHDNVPAGTFELARKDSLPTGGDR